MADPETTPAPGAPAPNTPPRPWMAQLPDDLKMDAELGKHETLGALAKDYKARMAELAAIERPPAKIEEYELKLPELPEDLKGMFANDSEFDATFRKKAIEAGLTKKQAAALYGIYHQAAADKVQAAQRQYRQTQEEAANALKKDWGDKFDAKVEMVNRFIRDNATEKVKDFFDKSGLGNQPEMIEWVAGLAEKFGEHGSGPASTTPPADAGSVLKAMYPSMKDLPDRVEL